MKREFRNRQHLAYYKENISNSKYSSLKFDNNEMNEYRDIYWKDLMKIGYNLEIIDPITFTNCRQGIID